MNNFDIAHFSLFVIDACQYIFEAITLIHVAFINKTEVSSKIFNWEISNIPLFLYFHILLFSTLS